MKQEDGTHHKTIIVAVAMHKDYELPDVDIYLPIHVGAELHPDIPSNLQQDNDGNNISSLNPYFSALIAPYWLWKNNDSNCKDLVHYWRYFATSNPLKWLSQNRFDRIFTRPKFEKTPGKHNVLPTAERHYVIETVASHYERALHSNQPTITGKVLCDLVPSYLESWERLFHKRSANIFTMMVMDRKTFDAYCAWLFLILFELTKRLAPHTIHTPPRPIPRSHQRIAAERLAWLEWHQVRRTAHNLHRTHKLAGEGNRIPQGKVHRREIHT